MASCSTVSGAMDTGGCFSGEAGASDKSEESVSTSGGGSNMLESGIEGKSSVVLEVSSSVAENQVDSVAECIVAETMEEMHAAEAMAVEPRGSPSSSSATTAAPSSSSLSSSSPFHHVKKILWKDKQTHIITQNENGPCPLIAITNVLLLREKLKLPPNLEVISASELLQMIGNTILENIPKNISAGVQLNFEQNMNDAMSVLPKLQTGLDVNVKFTGVQEFEYTPECIIFDLLNISLYHGWLVDPQGEEAVLAVGTTGYNQLVEKIITNKCSSDTQLVTEALIAEQFLEKTASQLTYHGLCELVSTMKEDELAVFFRNNHFSTVFKRKYELFQLVTDQGFLSETKVVWETLSNIEGDGEFVDGKFVTVPPKVLESDLSPLPAGATEEQQINHDYLVALSLQEEQKRQQEKEMAWEEFKSKQLGADTDISDEELARRLQEEEERQVQSQQQQGQVQGQPPQQGGQPGGQQGRQSPSQGVPQGGELAEGRGSPQRRFGAGSSSSGSSRGERDKKGSV